MSENPQPADIDEAYDAHVQHVRSSTAAVHERLADASRDLYQALETLLRLYNSACGLDCCPLGYSTYMPARQLLEEAQRNVVAAAALTGARL